MSEGFNVGGGLGRQGCFTTLAGALMCGLGVLLLSLVMSTLYDKITQGRWEAVPCVITTSVVRESVTSDRARYWSLALRFEYSWKDQTFSGEQSAVAGTKRKQEAQQHKKQFSVGTEHTCYVNPGDPSQSVIERDERPLWLVLLFVLVVGFVSCACLFSGTGIFFLGLWALLGWLFEGSISLRSAGAALSCFILVAMFAIDTHQARQEPEHYVALNPMYLEGIALAVTVLAQLSRRIFAVLYAAAFLIVGGIMASQTGAVMLFLSFAVCRLWPILRKRENFPWFMVVNFFFTTLLIAMITAFIYPDDPFTPANEEAQGNWLTYAWAVLYFALLGLCELAAREEPAKKPRKTTEA